MYLDRRLVLFLTLAGVITLGGCAATGEIEAVRAEAQRAQTTANEALSTARSALTTANEAKDLANQANARTRETEEKINRAFKRSMFK